MFDISKLPVPKLFFEYDLADKVAELKADLKAAFQAEGIDWTGSDADPIMKVFKALAAMDCLREQRFNDSARRVLLAFAKGDDLDNIRPDVPRLDGANATCTVEIEADSSGTVPSGFQLAYPAGNVYGKTTEEAVFSGPGTLEVAAEITTPAGIAGNGIENKLTEQVISNPIVVSVTQITAGTGGADKESDERYVQRLLLAPSSNMGGRRSYAFYTMSADVRIKDYKVKSPTPAHIEIVLLSDEGDGSADSAMIGRVEDAFSEEAAVTPQSDDVTVMSAEIIPYSLNITVYLYPEVEQLVVNQALANAKAAVAKLHKCGYDINESILKANIHVEGISKIVIENGDGTVWEDIECTEYQAAYCEESGIDVSFGGFLE